MSMVAKLSVSSGWPLIPQKSTFHSSISSRLTCADVCVNALAYGGFGDVAPCTSVDAADLIECAGGGEHPDHVRVLRIDVREEEQRTGQFACRAHREVRKRPDGDVDQRQCRAGVGYSASR